MAKLDVYQIITDQIIKKLEEGIIPWHKPWKSSEQWPKNFKSDSKYRGINVFLLLMAGYESPYWLTYKQISEKKGKVIKGEKSFPIVFWKTYTKKVVKEGVEKDETFFTLRYYRVFNLEQTEGIEYDKPEIELNEFNPIYKCESVISGMQEPPRIGIRGSRACYNPESDSIAMPKKETFDNPEHYYATLFHELGHSTGHVKRLDREGVTNIGKFGDHKYSKEEIVAEITSSFLCAETNINSEEIMDNSVAYISGWIKRLKDDPKLLILGAAQAQKAADYILNKKQEEE